MVYIKEYLILAKSVAAVQLNFLTEGKYSKSGLHELISQGLTNGPPNIRNNCLQLSKMRVIFQKLRLYLTQKCLTRRPLLKFCAKGRV